MKFTTLAFLALAQQAPALTIKIDYTYDTSNFFDTQVKKDAIEKVAKFYGDLIKDNLLRIDASEFPSASWSASPPFHPATGNSLSIANLVVPEDTIIIYVGARSLPVNQLGVGGPGGWNGSGFQPWFDRINGRGSAGAALAPAARTDHSPWGGAISFSNVVAWNFSQSQNQTGFEFISVALHEMGHVLGIGTADSWKNKISGGTVFNGAACIRSNGSAPPVQSGGSHFGGSTLVSAAFGCFGRSHGISRPVLMLASSTDDGSNFDVASDLDLAALIDCGWEISPPQNLTASTLKPAAAAFSWKSSSFYDYKVERGANLQAFTGGSSSVAGNGTVQAWTDPAAPAANTFYRLRATKVVGTAAAAPGPAAAPSSLNNFSSVSVPPRIATGCYTVDP